METWIKELLHALDRKRADMLFGEHAAKEKNLNTQDVDCAVKTVRIGKVDESKSTKEKQRVCFKNYFNEFGVTYFVIVEYYTDFLKVVTVNKKKGKY